MADKLFLFSTSFPYGKAEQFLEPEIVYLSKKFKEVYIFPEIVDGEARLLPLNCKVIPLQVNFKLQKKFRYYFLKNFARLIKYYFYLILVSKQRGYYLKEIRKTLIDLVYKIETAKLYYTELKDYLKQSNLLYFYWLRTPFIYFAIMKEQKLINHKLISRAHGWDYDPKQSGLGFYLYREFELKQVDKVVVASKWGSELNKNIYPAFASKISFMHLGVEANWVVNPITEVPIPHLVSCALLVELKRIDLTIEILKHVSIPLKWTHIGDGPLLEKIKQRAAELPLNIEVEFLGHRSNSFVLDYYKTVPCDLFITPTLLEAGVPEIVNERTGFLIDKDFDPKEAAKKMKDYFSGTKEAKSLLRKNARLFYESNFSAKKKYTEFIKAYLSPEN